MTLLLAWLLIVFINSAYQYKKNLWNEKLKSKDFEIAKLNQILLLESRYMRPIIIDNHRSNIKTLYREFEINYRDAWHLYGIKDINTANEFLIERCIKEAYPMLVRDIPPEAIRHIIRKDNFSDSIKIHSSIQIYFPEQCLIVE